MNPFAIPVMFGLGGQLLSELSENETKAGKRSSHGMAGLYKTGGITESIVCPGVDLDAYKLNCRAKVFRDHWNYWKVLRSTADGITLDKLELAGEAFMHMVNQDAVGKIRHVEVVTGKLANPWGTPVLENRNAVCMSPMTLRASDFAPAYYEVFIRFVYRGVENDLLWPARKVGLAGAASNTLGVHCPVGADWLLDAVYTPSSVNVPDVKTDSPVGPLYEDIDPGDLAPDLDFSTKIVLGGAGLLAVALAAGYAVRSFR